MGRDRMSLVQGQEEASASSWQSPRARGNAPPGAGTAAESPTAFAMNECMRGAAGRARNGRTKNEKTHKRTTLEDHRAPRGMNTYYRDFNRKDRWTLHNSAVWVFSSLVLPTREKREAHYVITLTLSFSKKEHEWVLLKIPN